MILHPPQSSLCWIWGGGHTHATWITSGEQQSIGVASTDIGGDGKSCEARTGLGVAGLLWLHVFRLVVDKSQPRLHILACFFSVDIAFSSFGYMICHIYIYIYIYELKCINT